MRERSSRSGGRSRRHFARFAVFVGLATGASAAAADVLVLRADGPSARRFPPGQRLPDSTTFALRPGDAVTILARGGTRTFRGPGTFSATGPATGGIASAGPRRNTGAVRDGPRVAGAPVPQPTDMWHLDVSRSGRACLAPGARPTLWRPNPADAVQLTITPPTGAPRTVDWPSGQATMPWPAAVPVADGASYQLSWTGGTAPRRFTLKALPMLPAADEALAAAFIANECINQLNVFIAARALPEAPSAASPAQ